MAEIKSAYRFVPVNKDQNFFSPAWKKDVSQDIPFENEVSGVINYTLTANTAIFVKGSDGEFCNVDGKYFIPGTTVKGCIRSVLEIMSFGHLDETRVKNNKENFAFRDINDQKGYMAKMGEVFCGWLTDDGKIVNWGKPIHIKYDSIISKITNCNIGTFRNLNTFEKYRKANGYLIGTFSNPSKLPDARPYDRRTFCEFQDSGQPGTVIFSGAMQNKKSDFVLLNMEESNQELQVDSKILSDFKKTNPNYGKIPINTNKRGRAVFFTKSNNNKVQTIGLSYLHKYYAKNTIENAVPKGLRGDDLDMADVIFGSVKHNLKGRVQFSAAMQKGNIELLLENGESILNVLGSPRASYYPTYLQDHATWDTTGAVISGIKRYPIKPQYDISKLLLINNDKKNYEIKFGNDSNNVYESMVNNRKIIPRDAMNHEINFDTVSKMKPLKDGSTFSGTIRFHNLKKEEVGALLSALTFYGHENECKHSLGQAKSHGYGNVSITIDSMNINQTEDRKVYMQSFANLMTNNMPILLGKKIAWDTTDQIKELLSMAKGFDQEELIDIFTPMLLEEFGRAKGDYMKNRTDFSSFIGITRISVQNQAAAPKIENLIAEATVSVFGGGIKQAKITEGKDQDKKELIVSGPKVKLKIGDKIQVKKIIKGGKITKLEFVKKI